MTRKKPPILNYPDDSAPAEGAFLRDIAIELLHPSRLLVEFLPPMATLLERVQKGGPKCPQCFCCDTPFTVTALPAFLALRIDSQIPNSAADPRRYRRALARQQEPVKALLGVAVVVLPIRTRRGKRSARMDKDLAVRGEVRFH